MTRDQLAALRSASTRLNSVKSELIRIYDALEYAGCPREAESVRNITRSIEDRQISWLRRKET